MSHFFRLQCIKVYWRLQFLEYLRSLAETANRAESGQLQFWSEPSEILILRASNTPEPVTFNIPWYQTFDTLIKYTLFWIQLFYPLRFSEYVHGLAFAVNLLWNWCVTDCFDQSKTTFVVIFFQRATGAPETEVAAESGNSVPAAGDLWSEAAAGLLHLPTFSTKGTVIPNK